MNKYLFVKEGASTQAVKALLQLVEFKCRAELRDDEAQCLCKPCYDNVVRMKKRPFSCNLGMQGSPVRDRVCIPTPTKFPASKRPTIDRPHSAMQSVVSYQKHRPPFHTMSLWQFPCLHWVSLTVTISAFFPSNC